MALDGIFIKRLAFIRFLFNSAIEQSRKAEPLCSASILMFHDAIELFLQLASECHNAGKSDGTFLGYWEILASRHIDLTQKESMRQLNNSRVQLKHYGTLPSKLAIESFRSNATSFFEENTPIVFGIALADVSLIDLIEFGDARNNLKETEKLLMQNKIDDALDKVAVAFHQLVHDYEQRKIIDFGRSPFFFGQDMIFISSFFMDFDQLPASWQFQQRMGEFVDKVKESLEAIQEAVRILSLRIDYRRYSKFRLLTPAVYINHDGSPNITRFPARPSNVPTADDVQFCIDFVIESAINLQEFDYSLERH